MVITLNVSSEWVGGKKYRPDVQARILRIVKGRVGTHAPRVVAGKRNRAITSPLACRIYW